LRFLNKLSFTVLLICSLSLLVFAQPGATATLSGRVLDPNGALVRGATVTATQKATGAKREATTNDDGSFVIPSLAGGGYEVKVQAQGFADLVLSEVTLQVGVCSTPGQSSTHLSNRLMRAARSHRSRW
jgi:hypothetical protein